MWLLAIIVVILSFNWPIQFGKDSHFIGFAELIRSGWITIVFVLIIIYGVLFYYYLIKHCISGTQNFSVQIQHIESKQSDPLAFLASYFIPLVSFQMDNLRHNVVLLGLFVVIGVMYVKGDLFHMNPTLLLLGFKMYSIKYGECNDEKGKTIIVISKSELQESDSIRYILLSKNIWFVFKTIEK
jgi:hypothetical protein